MRQEDRDPPKPVDSLNPGRNSEIVVTGGGIEIRRQGRPVGTTFGPSGQVQFLLDCSGSMNGEPLEQAKRGAKRFAVMSSEKGYSIGLISFGSDAAVVAAHGVDQQTLNHLIDRLSTAGTTNMMDAIDLAVRQFTDSNGPRVIVLVTDGVPDDSAGTIRQAKVATAAGIDIMTVGTDTADHAFLARIASRDDLAIAVNTAEIEQGIASAALRLPPARGV